MLGSSAVFAGAPFSFGYAWSARRRLVRGWPVRVACGASAVALGGLVLLVFLAAWRHSA